MPRTKTLRKLLRAPRPRKLAPAEARKAKEENKRKLREYIESIEDTYRSFFSITDPNQRNAAIERFREELKRQREAIESSDFDEKTELLTLLESKSENVRSRGRGRRKTRRNH